MTQIEKFPRKDINRRVRLFFTSGTKNWDSGETCEILFLSVGEFLMIFFWAV